MSFLAMLAASGGRVTTLQTRTFTASTTWPVPAGVTSLLSVSGKGADGSPAVDSTPVQKTDVSYTFYYRAANAGVYRTSTTVDGWPYGASAYCDPLVSTPDDPNFQLYEVCYTPRTEYVGGRDATTGAPATAFGKTFPGGAGGPASTTTFQNVAVGPGSSYNIVVPAGGLIVINYYG